jgi:hypothetical protein
MSVILDNSVTQMCTNTPGLLTKPTDKELIMAIYTIYQTRPKTKLSSSADDKIIVDCDQRLSIYKLFQLVERLIPANPQIEIEYSELREKLGGLSSSTFPQHVFEIDCEQCNVIYNMFRLVERMIPVNPPIKIEYMRLREQLCDLYEIGNCVSIPSNIEQQ